MIDLQSASICTIFWKKKNHNSKVEKFIACQYQCANNSNI